jgi:hypothetical protein
MQFCWVDAVIVPDILVEGKQTETTSLSALCSEDMEEVKVETQTLSTKRNWSLSVGVCIAPVTLIY